MAFYTGFSLFHTIERRTTPQPGIAANTPVAVACSPTSTAADTADEIVSSAPSSPAPSSSTPPALIVKKAVTAAVPTSPTDDFVTAPSSPILPSSTLANNLVTMMELNGMTERKAVVAKDEDLKPEMFLNSPSGSFSSENERSTSSTPASPRKTSSREVELIMNMTLNGKAPKEIAELLDMKRNTVAKIIERKKKKAIKAMDPQARELLLRTPSPVKAPGALKLKK